MEHWIVPFCWRNREQAADIFLRTWPMMVVPCIIATAYGSLQLPSLSHKAILLLELESKCVFRRDALEHSIYSKLHNPADIFTHALSPTLCHYCL